MSERSVLSDVPSNELVKEDYLTKYLSQRDTLQVRDFVDFISQANLTSANFAVIAVGSTVRGELSTDIDIKLLLPHAYTIGAGQLRAIESKLKNYFSSKGIGCKRTFYYGDRYPSFRTEPAKDMLPLHIIIDDQSMPRSHLKREQQENRHFVLLYQNA